MRFDPSMELLVVQLTDQVTRRDISDAGEALTEALRAVGTARFRLFVDLRGLFPMEGDCVDAFSKMKRQCAESSGFSGIGVLADSATVAMQQHNTRLNHDNELITTDASAANAFVEGDKDP